MGCFDTHRHGEMITIIKLINIRVTSQIPFCVCVWQEHLRFTPIYPLGKVQGCGVVVLTTVSQLYVRFPDRSHPT